MKREIKFRAWAISLKDMLPNVQNHIGNNGWAFGQLLKDEKFTLMQFTGLHDKNGKEIYEGDILDGQMVVTWRNDLASFALSKQGWAYDHYFGEAVDPGHTEVIGNIHQNPELLQP